jgi:hypothetical protein
VADLSIYGRKELFDELEMVLQEHDSAIRLRKRETDYGDEFVDTEKVIQSLTALMPNDIPVPSADGRRTSSPETVYRVYAYRHRARCLKDFAKIMQDQAAWADAHSYFLDVAWEGWQLYCRLRGEQYFSFLQKVEKDETNGRRVAADGVPDGIVFPMLSAMSRFVVSKNGKRHIDIPKNFPWETLFEMASLQFKGPANHNPNTMGKRADCYIALHGLLTMFFAMTGRP